MTQRATGGAVEVRELLLLSDPIDEEQQQRDQDHVQIDPAAGVGGEAVDGVHVVNERSVQLGG